MGIIYKFKPEIKDYVLEEKKAKPVLSCRGLVALVEHKFKISVSKSGINAIIKEAGLSLPVGRRLKKRRRKRLQVAMETPLLETEVRKLIEAPVEVPSEAPIEKPSEAVPVEKIAEKPSEPLPVEPLVEVPLEKPAEVLAQVEELPLEIDCRAAILLKVADYLMGGSSQITEIIKARLKPEERDLLALTESIIYLSLFETSKEEELKALWAMVNKKIPPETIMRYLAELQQIRELPLDIFRVISNLFQEVRCLRVSLSDGGVFYLDGQLRTIWSTPQIPDVFSTTIYNIKSYINKYFKENKPFILFSSPGYDTPTKEFFDFLFSLEGVEKKISKLTLYDHKFDEIESIFVDQVDRHSFVFGLWPWQFGQFRKVKSIGEFKPGFFEPFNRGVYLANIELELLQPTTNKRLTLIGCALKTNPQEKIRLVILTNLFLEEIGGENLAKLYLSHWPNLEEGFQDFSRKVELFTYTASSRPIFSLDSLNFNQPVPANINIIFDYYLKTLDLYLRRYILPSGYENQDFSTTNERFYRLKAQLKQEKACFFLKPLPPSGYPFLKDLEYACRRINEKEMVFADAKRLWCNLP